MYEQACESLDDYHNDENKLLANECYNDLTNEERIKLKATAKKRRQTSKKKERLASVEQ